MRSYVPGKNRLFTDNLTKSNNEKYHLIFSTNDFTKIQIEDFSVTSSSSKKLLGVNIDRKLNFDSHVNYSAKQVKK